MRVVKEFSKNAKEYEKYNTIQEKVVKELIKRLKKEYKNILDVGCGNGLVYKYINWQIEKFIAIDFSKEMLKLHPTNKNIIKKELDFNSKEFLNFIKKENFDIFISSSALQWAKNLKDIFEVINNKNIDFAIAIFTSNTFRTIHQIANTTSPIKSKEEILKVSQILNANIEFLNYKLEFEKKEDIFKYIKKSGVSGGRNILSYKQIKELIKKYPYNYLEFEIILLWSKQ